MGIALTGRWPNLREAVTLTTAVALFVCVTQLLGPVLDGARPAVMLLEPLPGLPVAFSVEPLGMLFALIASGLWIVNSIYSIGYMRGNRETKPDTLLHLFRAGNRRRAGDRLRRQPADPVSVLRSADADHLSAGHACRHRQGDAPADARIWRS